MTPISEWKEYPILKVNVGRARKLSRDFNSTRFSVNLEREVGVPLDDPEDVVEKTKELYALAEESLNLQVERYEGELARASRDEAPSARNDPPPSRSSTGNRRGNGYGRRAPPPPNGNGHRCTSDDVGFTPASNKQISYLNNLTKRQGLTTPQLRQRVTEIVDREVDLYDLSNSEAGIVLDELTAENPSLGRRRR